MLYFFLSKSIPDYAKSSDTLWREDQNPLLALSFGSARGVYTDFETLPKKVGSISQNGQKWREFLDCASKFYKYSFTEQVLIFAQRPTATACAPYDLWNHHFERYIKRGSSGIALLSPLAKGSGVGLRYVFDVADTKSKNGQEIKLWDFDIEKHQSLLQKIFSEITCLTLKALLL